MFILTSPELKSMTFFSSMFMRVFSSKLMLFFLPTIKKLEYVTSSLPEFKLNKAYPRLNRLSYSQYLAL